MYIISYLQVDCAIIIKTKTCKGVSYTMNTKSEEIKKTIDKIRPYLQRDGGDVEFVEFKDGIVYVRMLGACIDCGMIDDTLKDGVEAILLDEVDGVVEVKLVNE